MARNGCMVALAASVNINGSMTAVPFSGAGAEVYDDGGWHDPSGNPAHLVVPAGVDRVRVGFNCSFANVAGGTMVVSQILKNGGVYPGRAAQTATANGSAASTQGPRTSAFTIVPVVEGDVFTLSVNSIPTDTSFDLDAEKTNFYIEAVPA